MKQQASRQWPDEGSESAGTAYGLATGLVYEKYRNIPGAHRQAAFWREVDDLYREFVQHQRLAVSTEAIERPSALQAIRAGEAAHV